MKTVDKINVVDVVAITADSCRIVCSKYLLKRKGSKEGLFYLPQQ
jgi:hypothetical protein